MVKEHVSEDQRIAAIEHNLPGIRQSLARLSAQVNSTHNTSGSLVGMDFMPVYNVPNDAVVFEQTLGLLRTLYRFQTPPLPITSLFAVGTVPIVLLPDQEIELLTDPGVATSVCFYIVAEGDSEFKLTLTKPDGSIVEQTIRANNPRVVNGQYTSVKLKGTGMPATGPNSPNNVGFLVNC